DWVNSPTLTLEEASSFTDDELNKFSEMFIETNESLFYDYENSKCTRKKDADGRDVFRMEYEKLDLPKRDDESFMQYLQRVLADYEKRTDAFARKSILGAINPLPETFTSSIFSGLLEDNMRISNQLGDTLSKFSSPLTDRLSMKPDLASSIFSSNRERDSFVFPTQESLAYETNERLDKVIDNLDALSPLITNAAMLIK